MPVAPTLAEKGLGTNTLTGTRVGSNDLLSGNILDVTHEVKKPDPLVGSDAGSNGLIQNDLDNIIEATEEQ
ncbi:MAG: hypothetical protein ABII21_00935 [bacterium]